MCLPGVHLVIGSYFNILARVYISVCARARATVSLQVLLLILAGLSDCSPCMECAHWGGLSCGHAQTQNPLQCVHWLQADNS